MACRTVLLTLVALVATPAAASAATYDVYSCSLPNGEAAPTEGWASATRGRGSTYDGCNKIVVTRGFLAASFLWPAAAGDNAGWVFSAPSDTSIGSYTLWRWVRSGRRAWSFEDYYLSHDVPMSLDIRYFSEWCSPHTTCWELGTPAGDHMAAANRVQRTGLQIQRLNAFLSCRTDGVSNCDGTGERGYFAIYSARVGLNDLYAPRFQGNPSGSLVEPGVLLEGEKTISFAARDRGGGIEKVGVVVDEQPRLTRAADANATRCRRPFTALKPCPPASDNTLVFDTAQLANGAHSVQASVTDAAGNETRSDPVTVTTRNGSRPNGRGATPFVRLSAWLRSRRNAQRSSVVVPFGSVRTAEGRLTDSAGAPIAGAVLDVKSRVRRPGARHRPAGTVTTNDNGRFAYRVARGPSRTLRFEYRAYSLDPAPVSSAAVTLGVRAGIRLGVKPRRVRNGQKVRFRGRLKGGPARKGTRVTIDVIVPDARRRVPIGNVKADAKGRFRFDYRFRRTLVKARYRFQARLVPQPGYPYRGATSRRVSVIVQP
jgi:hypothetical protein